MVALMGRLADSARRAVERVHGEAATVRPVDRVGGPNSGERAASATRPAYLTQACFYEDSDNRNLVDSQPLIPGGGQLISRATTIRASIRLSEASPLRTGDMLERAGGGRWYEINEIDPDGLGGALLTLSIAKPLTLS